MESPVSESQVPAEVCTNENVARARAATLRVRDAMVATPKTVPADATVGDLRALFTNPHVVTALVVDGPMFVGVVQRGQLDGDLPDEQPAGALASRDVPTIEPDAPLGDALEVLDSHNERRLVVLDAHSEQLRGLLCLTSRTSLAVCRSSCGCRELLCYGVADRG